MLHIGKEIQNVVKEKNCTVSWLARELSCSRTNVYKIFERPYIDTITLYRVSLVLNHDFFAHYTHDLIDNIDTNADFTTHLCDKI